MADPDPSKIKHGGRSAGSSMASRRWTSPPLLASGRDGVVGSLALEYQVGQAAASISLAQMVHSCQR